MHKSREAEQSRLDRQALKARIKLALALRDIGPRIKNINEPELARLCYELGLSGKGDKADLIERIQNYIWGPIETN